MIVGIGTDIIEIRRIKEAVDRNSRFIDKMFTKNEQQYLQSRNMRPEYVAGRFAAKEAVVKALGTGFSGFDFKDVEIDRTAAGRPIVILKGKARLTAQKFGEYKFHLSISHGTDNAIAYAVLEVDKFEDCSCRNNEENRQLHNK